MYKIFKGGKFHLTKNSYSAKFKKQKSREQERTQERRRFNVVGHVTSLKN